MMNNLTALKGYEMSYLDVRLPRRRFSPFCFLACLSETGQFQTARHQQLVTVWDHTAAEDSGTRVVQTAADAGNIASGITTLIFRGTFAISGVIGFTGVYQIGQHAAAHGELSLLRAVRYYGLRFVHHAAGCHQHNSGL